MNKYFSAILVLLCALSMQAQVNVSDALKPSQQHRLSVIPTTNKEPKEVVRLSHMFVTKGGIRLAGADQGLIGSDDHGYATYHLDKKYAKMSFWFGSAKQGGGKTSKAILTIEADGRRIFDKPVFNTSVPEFITLDVSGKDSVSFKVLIGTIDVALAYLQLWKEGEKVVAPPLDYDLPEGRAQLVEQIMPYFTKGTATAIHEPYPTSYSVAKSEFPDSEKSISIGRHTFTSGLKMANYEGLCDESSGDAYFWLRKKYDKLSFIVGPRDNKSSNASAWLVVYGDKNKILYEEIVRQTDLPRQVVLDVAGQERLQFSCEYRSSEFLGGITFGVVDIYAYTKGYADIPKEGVVNVNKDEIAKLPSPCALMSNIKPYSVHGFANPDAVRFSGESSYITFSMGGEKFSEGLILTTGKKLFGDQVEAYMTFDLAGEFDYISFYAGMLTKHRALDDDRILVYADSVLILDTMVYCTWPNQYFELPLNKCRILKFAKRGNPATDRQCYIGVGDIALYRGKPVQNDLFYHEKPDCPDEADLIDLCEKPYFHYVGRFLSSLTNFDFNDCFKNGSTKREYFRMKDGSQIYKGVMLEANMPLGLESVTVTDAVMMCLVGAGSAIGSSNMSAYTGVSAGAGLAGDIAILHLMNNKSGGQASVVSFNPFGEYKSLTFSVANKSEYWDDMDMLLSLGERKDHHFRLNVIADQRIVKQIDLYNRMEPQTFTVPIYNCHQLTFWLEPGDVRSGQFVLYDMTVSKSPAPEETVKEIKKTEEKEETKEEEFVQPHRNNMEMTSQAPIEAQQ